MLFFKGQLISFTCSVYSRFFFLRSHLVEDKISSFFHEMICPWHKFFNISDSASSKDIILLFMILSTRSNNLYILQTQCLSHISDSNRLLFDTVETGEVNIRISDS